MHASMVYQFDRDGHGHVLAESKEVARNEMTRCEQVHVKPRSIYGVCTVVELVPRETVVCPVCPRF